MSAIGHGRHDDPHDRYPRGLRESLAAGERRLDHEEQGLTARRVRVDEFERMARKGVVTDATSIAAYGLLLLRGRATGGR